MEEQLTPLAATHLLQHTLRSLCLHENSQWIYAVFWRILPRNYPPPKWDVPGGAYDRSRGNRRNWILVWEDGFCNFSCSVENADITYGNSEFQHLKGLQPELFFKMSHEIYSYGEGLIGKVAADHSHKWVFKEPYDQEINFLSAWHNPADSYPRTWDAQFQSGIETIALIAVREGVVQLGSVNKVMEDLTYVFNLRKKFNYLESIPGVLLPHPSSIPFPVKIDDCNVPEQLQSSFQPNLIPPTEFYDQMGQTLKVTPSMSSLEALLSKLPSVRPSPCASSSPYYDPSMIQYSQRTMEQVGMDKVAKEEKDELYGQQREMGLAGESSNSIPHYHLNVTKTNKGF